jgi:hypothetical protein
MKAGRSVPVLVLAALVACCSRRAESVPGSELASDVPARYRFLYRGFVAAGEEPQHRAELPFERIELSGHGSKLFSFPSIRLARDGRAEIASDPPRRGRVHLFDYARLCELLEHARFASMAREYTWEGFDLPTYTVTVWPTGGGEPVAVADCGAAGPAELWGLRAAIEGVAGRIDWE